MKQITTDSSTPDKLAFVPETRFGVWFLRTKTWSHYVLEPALDDLQRLLPTPAPVFETILDIGTGHGYSITELGKRFKPKKLIAMDADRQMPDKAHEAIAASTCPVTVLCAPAEATGLPDASVDAIFCHQTFHHIVDQERAIKEMYRVLKPGGWLLFAESTKRYIYSLQIRILFRHPMHVQKTASEYLALVRATGFRVDAERVSYPYLWWSREDVGAFEWFGFPPKEQKEPTLINLVAQKPD